MIEATDDDDEDPGLSNTPPPPSSPSQPGAVVLPSIAVGANGAHTPFDSILPVSLKESPHPSTELNPTLTIGEIIESVSQLSEPLVNTNENVSVLIKQEGGDIKEEGCEKNSTGNTLINLRKGKNYLDTSNSPLPSGNELLATPGSGSDGGRPGAPHYCEICGKVCVINIYIYIYIYI